MMEVNVPELSVQSGARERDPWSASEGAVDSAIRHALHPVAEFEEHFDMPAIDDILHAAAGGGTPAAQVTPLRLHTTQDAGLIRQVSHLRLHAAYHVVTIRIRVPIHTIRMVVRCPLQGHVCPTPSRPPR